MRLTQYLLAAALALGISGPALAQGTATTPSSPSSTVGHWTASGFVGGTFNRGASTTLVGPAGNSVGVDFSNSGGVEYGGELGYQWHNMIGAEFLASFAPFDVTSFAISTDRNPRSHAYMANAIALIPVGSEVRFQPYVSGGIGGIGMSADVLTLNGVLVTSAGTVANVTTTRASRTSFGEDFGGGVMAFASDRFGFRGDVRYYHASTDNNIVASDLVQTQVVRGLLSGLHFWRADGGVTFRW